MAIYWTAKNNNSFLNGHRSATTMRSAVRDAHRYVDNELYGDGKIFYYADPDDLPVRVDTKNIFTNHKWITEGPDA